MTNKLNTNLNNTKLKIIADLFKQHPEIICTDRVIEL